MATKAPNPIPDGMHSITTQLWFNGNCREAVDFYKKVFDAKPIGDIMYGPDGQTVMHAMMTIGDSSLMLADAVPGNYERGPEDHATASIYLYVEDCDKVYNLAVDQGCEVIHQMMDAFWGDRSGKVRDPFGHTWDISTNKWIMTPEEMAEGQEEWMKSIVENE